MRKSAETPAGEPPRADSRRSRKLHQVHSSCRPRCPGRAWILGSFSQDRPGRMNCPDLRASTCPALARSRPEAEASLARCARSLRHQTEIETIGNVVEREPEEVDFVAGAESADHSEVRKIGERLGGCEGVMRRGGLTNDDIVDLRQTRGAGRGIGASRGPSGVIRIGILTGGGGVSRAEFPGLGGLCGRGLRPSLGIPATSLAGRLTAGRPIGAGPSSEPSPRASSASRASRDGETPGDWFSPWVEAPVRISERA